MSVRFVLAVLPVADIDVAREWYSRLFAGPPTNTPMPTLVEWRVVDSAWLQVTVDRARAGSGLCNLAVDDLDADVAALRERGLDVDDVETANKGVRLAAMRDPDGNTITLIGGFREMY